MAYYTMEYTMFDKDIPDAGGMMCALTPSGDYIGDEETAKRLCDVMGIKPEKISPDHQVCSIGFCENDQKWYGWSHRAIFGFGVGSVVKKGHCGYTPDNPEEMIEEHVNWLDGTNADQRRKECQILPDRSGIRILHSPLVIPMATSIDDALELLDDEKADVTPAAEHDLYGGNNAVEIRLCGIGEWKAESLDDAKKMAVDFANAVA